MEASPSLGADAPSRFRLREIPKRILNVPGVYHSLEGVRRLFLRLSFQNLSSRPLQHGANPVAPDHFRNNFSELATDAVGEATGLIEIWVQEVGRVGRQGMLSRVCARKGTRPRIPRDRRFGYC